MICLLRRLDTKIFCHSIVCWRGQDRISGSVLEGNKTCKASSHRNVGDFGYPYLVGAIDHKIFELIKLNFMILEGNVRSGG